MFTKNSISPALLESVKQVFTGEHYINESKTPYELYHPTYSAAIHHALSHHAATKGLSVSDDDYHQHIAIGPRKPPEGEGLQHILPATDKHGNEHQILIQVYNKGGKTPYELNTYSNKVPQHLKYSMEQFEQYYKEMISEATSKKMSSEDTANKRASVASDGIKGLFKVYGDSGVRKPDGTIEKRPPTEGEHKKAVAKRFAELDAMSHEQREREYKEAHDRMTAAGARPDNILSNKTKTDTAAQVVGTAKDAKNGHISLGMNGSPDSYHFHHDDSGHNFTIHNSCAGSTEGCRLSCLSKQGLGAQATIMGHRDAYEQKANHNAAAQKDFHTVMHMQLDRAARNAKKQGKHVLVRPDVNTGNKHNRYAKAISNSFGPNSSRVAAGTHAIVQVHDYSKSSGEHNPSEGIYATHSDLGPLVHNGTGHVHEENVRRRGTMERDTQVEGKGSYTVFNRPRPTEEDVAKNSKTNKEYNDTMNRLHTVRRYEPHPTEPAKGEKPEYHHKDGYGRVIAKDGKSYRYQDHPVSDKHKLVDGSEVFAGDTDARHLDRSDRKYKTNPHKTGTQHVVGTVTPAFTTSSTSQQKIQDSALFHDVKDIDAEGIYHDSHPDKVIDALKTTPNMPELPGRRKVIPIKSEVKEEIQMGSFAERLVERAKVMKEKKDSILVPEEKMTPSQMKKREEIIMSMKSKIGDFKKKYGARWKNVMYATATKMAMAMQEEVEELDELSYDTLTTYKNAARRDIYKRAHAGKPLPGQHGKVAKRIAGWKKANEIQKKMEEEIELSEGHSMHTHTVHFADPHSGEWKGKMLVNADNDKEAINCGQDMANKQGMKLMKVSRNNVIMSDKTHMEEVDIWDDTLEEKVNPRVKTVDMLRGPERVPASYDNEHKSYKIQLKAEEEKHDDEEEDKKLIKKMVDPSCIKNERKSPMINVKEIAQKAMDKIKQETMMGKISN